MYEWIQGESLAEKMDRHSSKASATTTSLGWCINSLAL